MTSFGGHRVPDEQHLLVACDTHTVEKIESAEKYFVGNAQTLKKLEMVENSLREKAKIVITEQGISPTLLLGSLPVRVSRRKGAK